MTKTNVYDVTKHFTLGDYNTSISKEEYETNFTKTNNRFEAQFNLEMRFHLNLAGAAFKVFDKHNNLIYKGTC